MQCELIYPRFPRLKTCSVRADSKAVIATQPAYAHADAYTEQVDVVVGAHGGNRAVASGVASADRDYA